MTTTPGPQQVREIVSHAFEDLGVDVGDSPDLGETLLLHDGHYFARSYRGGGLMAMWFVENGFIQFYDAEGQMLRTVNLDQDSRQQRKAA